jgi:DNA polymerase-3 subunit epsilon
MRLVFLDTETTGLEVSAGHRVIEVGCIEVVHRRLTDRTFHHYVNPERASDPGALAVHGLADEFLADKPKFAEIADELTAFVADAEVVIHNAAFDLEFLDSELARSGRGRFVEHCARVTDSLALAREQHPGKRNSLDALCERYQVSNAHRTLHGALLDAGLLAEVYLAMTRGQDGLVIDFGADAALDVASARIDPDLLRVVLAGADEIAAHEALLDGIEKERGGVCVWRAPA